MSQLSEDQTPLVYIASLDYLHLAVISIGEIWLVKKKILSWKLIVKRLPTS